MTLLLRNVETEAPKPKKPVQGHTVRSGRAETPVHASAVKAMLLALSWRLALRTCHVGWEIPQELILVLCAAFRVREGPRDL